MQISEKGEPGVRAPGAALVTGAVHRIGRAIALALGRAGYRVVVHARTDGEASRTILREMTTLGQSIHPVFADLADPGSAAALIPAAVAAAGPLSLLVNNASVFETDEVGALDKRVWDDHFAINLRAPVFLAEAFAAELDPAAPDPCIINITDQRVLKPVPRQFSYTLSKSGLHAATTMLAQALAPRVRVNAVAPGPTLPSPRQDAAEFARQGAALPLGRGPLPEDIAAAVLYLAKARSVTGVTLPVDGGQHTAWRTPDVDGIEE